MRREEEQEEEESEMIERERVEVEKKKKVTPSFFSRSIAFSNDQKLPNPRTHFRLSIASLLGSSSSPKEEPLPIARGRRTESDRRRRRRRQGAREKLLLPMLVDELATDIDFEVEATIVVIAAVACCCRRSGRVPPPHGRVVAERAEGRMLLLVVRVLFLALLFLSELEQEKRKRGERFCFSF